MLLQSLRQFTTNPTCKASESSLCRDESTALILKFVAIASILVAGFGGIAIPLVGKHHRFLRTDGEVLPAAKAFAAGVILATGFVHMLNDASEALNNPCLKSYSHVWQKFPFTGFFAMVSALFTLFVDFVGTQYYERREKGRKGKTRCGEEHGGVVVVVDEVEEELLGSGIVEVKEVFGEESSGGEMHIVGMHAHAAQDRHHGHGHSHSHSFEGDDDQETSTRHVVVSQVTTSFSSLFFSLPPDNAI